MRPLSAQNGRVVVPVDIELGFQGKGKKIGGWLSVGACLYTCGHGTVTESLLATAIGSGGQWVFPQDGTRWNHLAALQSPSNRGQRGFVVVILARRKRGVCG